MEPKATMSPINQETYLIVAGLANLAELIFENRNQTLNHRIHDHYPMIMVTRFSSALYISRVKVFYPGEER